MDSQEILQLLLHLHTHTYTIAQKNNFGQISGISNTTVMRYLYINKWKNIFHEVTSLHPPSFHRNDFSTCSTHFSLGVCAAHVDLCTRMRTRTTPPFLRTCNARVCYGVVQCLPVKSPTIYRRNLRREKNDRLVSVHISIDSGDVW